jgi:hypothetical protein
VLQHSNMCVHSSRSECRSCTWDQPRRVRVHGCTLLGQFAQAHCRYERYMPTRGKQKHDTLIHVAAAVEALTTCLHINTHARSINYVTCSYDPSSPLLCTALALTDARSPWPRRNNRRPFPTADHIEWRARKCVAALRAGLQAHREAGRARDRILGLPSDRAAMVT